VKRIIFLLMAGLISLLLFIGQACADGSDNCTYRPPNPNEIAFFRNFAALRASVPPAPDGWELRENEQLNPDFSGVPEQVCNESDRYALELDLVYQLVPNPDQDEAALRRAQDATPGKAAMAEIETLQARQMKLAEEATAAANRGDMAAVDKINVELDALSQHIQQKFDALYAPQAEITADLARDRSATIHIEVNGSGGDCNGNPQPIAISNAVAYRCSYDDGYTSSGSVLDHASASILIVLGKAEVRTQDWSRLGSDQQEFNDQLLTLEAVYDRARPLMAQNAVIRIDSDNPERVEGLFRGLKLDALQKLVNH